MSVWKRAGALVKSALGISQKSSSILHVLCLHWVHEAKDAAIVSTVPATGSARNGIAAR